MTEPVVLTGVRDGLMEVTINRPDKRNALNAEVVSRLDAVLADAEQDASLTGILFTGAGENAFIAGADITEVRSYSFRDGLSSHLQRLCDRIEAFPRPTVAAVNGYALGGGCELAMACDIRMASETATFALPETALGVLPGAGGTQRLSRLVGRGRATEMILTGRFVGAAEALTAGLVTTVCPPDELLDTARECLTRISARGPVAVELAKTVIRHGLDADQGTGMLIERLAQSVLYTTRDKAEGASAFLDKREPRFSGE